MKRREFLIRSSCSTAVAAALTYRSLKLVVSAAASVVAFAALPSLLSAANSPPNVLFIAIDDLNDWVGFLGGHPQVKTPHMDRLAKRGVVFGNAHCAAPLCAPSRAAVFSGRQPYHTGIYNNGQNLRKTHPKLVLLPQHFQANGYRTFGTGKLLGRDRDLYDESYFTQQRWSPFTQEQVEYTAEELPSKRAAPRHIVQWGSDRPKVVLPLNGMPSDRSPDSPGGESFDWGALDIPDHEMGDARIADWAAQRLRRDDDGKPFFLGVGFYRPHIPLFAPRKYFEMYPAESIMLPHVVASDLNDLGPTGRRVALKPVTAGSHATVLKYGQWEEAVRAYLACVSLVDAQVGRLLDALDCGPHGDNTLIILWSDHGWHLGEKQHWGKWTGWERSTRVPLLVVPPKVSARHFKTGGVCRQPVGLIDLYPTLIELCGLTAGTRLDGISLVPYLRDPDAIDERAVVTTFGEGNYAVRDRRWRWIRYSDGSEELYDCKNDPHEWKNMAADPSHAPVKRGLARWLPGK